MNTWEISIYLFEQPHSLFGVSNPNKCTIHSDIQFMFVERRPSVPNPVHRYNMYLPLLRAYK